MDGGLQIALLWAKHMLGGDSLPTKVGQLQTFGKPVEGAIKATLSGKVVRKSKAMTEIAFTGEDGALVAMSGGVETHLLPS